MDPNAALEAIREARAEVLRLRESETSDAVDYIEPAQALADSVEALDEWLTGGGFTPAAWGAR